LRSIYPDPCGDNADTEYGLFKFDNSPEPVATALTLILPASPRCIQIFDPARSAEAVRIFTHVQSIGAALTGSSLVIEMR